MSRLASAFYAEFDEEPRLFVRAPGRVNLIGDHTDYNGLPVFPMAIQREVGLALRPRDDGLVRLRNVDPEFDPVEFEITPALRPHDQGHWANYCMAPANELARRFAIWRGFDGVIASDLPVASGLSSSSALVNAVGLALAELNEVRLPTLQMADLMAEAERFTGTRGGGMDQAASLAGRAGHALHITFDPLHVRPVAIPSNWRVVVADTGVRAEKSGSAQATYNLRRSECEQALEKVAEQTMTFGMTIEPPRSYRALLDRVGQDGATVAAEAALSGNLLRRFRHVVSESIRVDRAADLILGADLHGFGGLMDASHGSLHADYHVSTRELDELVAIAREGGAEGARLTGAGLGGCIVAIAEASTVDGVIQQLTADYFVPRGMAERLDDHLFVAEPAHGATVTWIGSPRG